MNPIPYGRQHIDENDLNAVLETLKSDFLTQGPKVKEFENKFANYIGVNYAVAVSNATAALHISVLAKSLKKNEAVITSPITFAASANCIRYAGGQVWFADIDSESYLLSYESTRALIESKPSGFFKGIIPVDFGGLPVNLEKFRDLANEHDMWIIEDACHAPGGYFIDSKGEKQMCGNCKYSDFGIFSFHPVKHIACGEGGMITTNSKEMYERLIMLRSHGITKNQMSKNDGPWYYEMKELGYNYRLTDIQSSIGITQLEKNKYGVERRNKIAKKYKKAFQDKIKFQVLPENFYNAHHLFVIESEKRDELYEFLKINNIFTQIHYIPVHTLPYYKKIGYKNADLINSENYYSKCISLPMFPSLKDSEQDYIINKVISFLNG